MVIRHSKSFIKSYKSRIKPYPKLKKKFEERVGIFIRDRSSPVIKDHKLTGKFRSFRAFWITGDYRIIYFEEADNVVLFIDVGTHNQVFK